MCVYHGILYLYGNSNAICGILHNNCTICTRSTFHLDRCLHRHCSFVSSIQCSYERSDLYRLQYFVIIRIRQLSLSRYRVFIKYCVFSEEFKIFQTLAFLCFPSVSVCVHTHTRQVEHQPCSRTSRVQKNHKI